jgi:benzoyl-CoA reductase/2-hydroxyglutaryl-CoA dehydratase subunit BcrC/BadD/HgdB
LFSSSIQLNELTQTNHILQNKNDEMRKTYELKLFDQSSILEHDNLQQENQLFRNAIDQWSNRYDELRLKLEQLTKYSLFTLLN